MKKLFTLLVVPFVGISLVGNISNAVAQNPEAPPTQGQCFDEDNYIENCWQNVEWLAVSEESDSYIGANTISRQGNAINFDLYFDDMYARYSGNCESQIVAVTRATDVRPDPDNFFSVNALIGPALNLACSIETN